MMSLVKEVIDVILPEVKEQNDQKEIIAIHC